MQRSNATVLVLLAVAAAGALFLVTDPLGLLESKRDAAPDPTAVEGLGARGPRLEGAGAGTRRPMPRTVGDEPVGQLRLALGDGTLTGLVTGAGRPLAEARVEPVLPPPFRAAVRTDEAGRWEIRGLPEGQFDLRVSAEGWRSRTEVAPRLAAQQSLEVPAIDLARRPALNDGLEVKVTDLAGRPIAGARVLATTLPWDVHLGIGPERAGVRGAVSRSAASDEQGLASLPGLLPQTYNVVVTAPGMCLAAWNSVVLAHGHVEKLTARLSPGASIQGRVVDASGKPVANAKVLGLHQPTFMSSVLATSVADGTFSLDGLREGKYWVMAFEDQHGRGQANPVASPSQGTVIKLGGAGTITGTVVDADGKPVPDATVRPHSSEPFGYVYSRVIQARSDGTFTASLNPGTWNLDAWDAAGTLSQGTKVPVKVGETSQVTIRLSAAGVVKGVVTDAQGNHVEGAEVYVRMGGFPPGPNREQYARTDAEGAFEVKGLALETVKLHVRHPQFVDTVWEGKPSPASVAAPVTIRLSAGARVEGHLRGADGNPLAGEQVNLFQNFMEARSVFADAQGAYAFDAVAAGTWQMTTGVFENGASGMSREGVQVPAQGTVTVDFAAEGHGLGTLTGSISLSGKPAVGATVRIEGAGGAAGGVSTTTDANGRFALPGVDVGEVRVVIQTAEGQTVVRQATVDATTKTGTLTVAIGGATVRGRVLQPNGEPITGAWLSLELVTGEGGLWSRVKAQKTTATDGTWEAQGLEAGTYVLRVSSGEWAQHLSDPFPLGGSEAKDLGDVRLTAGATLSGRVTDDAGTPVEDATVSLRDAQGRAVFNFSLSTTGSDGRYALHGVLPGTYTVRFEARGHSPDERPATLTAEGGSVDAVLARGGAVGALVEDDAGRPLAGARVRLLDAAGRPVERTLSLVNLFDGDAGLTGADGSATIADLAAGTYRVKVVKDGWTQDGTEPEVSVAAGAASSVRLRMVAAAPR